MNDQYGKVVIVVPCFNESRRLDVAAFRAFAERRPGLYFLFVDDGSTDQTARVVDNLRDVAPQSFDTIHLACNCGKAEAVRRGMQQAFSTGAEYVGFWDADLATPLEMIDVFYSVLSRRPEIAMVFGARLSLLGHSIRRSALRGLLGRAFAYVASLLFGFRIQDTQCGAKLFRSSSIAHSLFQQPFLSRWIFDVEIVSRFINATRFVGLQDLTQMIYECPLDEWREIPGGSIRSRDFYRSLVELAAIYWRYLRPGAATLAVSHDDTSSQAVNSNASQRMQNRDPPQARAA